MWHSSAPHWHGIARADVFMTARGPVVCELNSDTPSGEAEAVVLGALAAKSGCEDPSRALEGRFCDAVAAITQAMTGKTGALSVGIVYPTEITEDLSMIALYRRWFEARGWSVSLGSPYNLLPVDGRRVALFGRPLDAVVRHYKTDWWGERLPAWDDAERYADEAPLEAPLGHLLGAAVRGGVAVVNPFGAVLTQNKRAMAFMWQRRELFSEGAQRAITRFVPETVRLEDALDEVRGDPASWVIKSDYGCEGDEVVIGAECTREEWEACILHAVPGRWIAQRRFEPLRDAREEATNLGVFVVGGEACGVLARIEDGATSYAARTAPVLVEGAR
jgi:glutathionylspermidine synthase